MGENDKRVGKKLGREQERIERTGKMNEIVFCAHGLDPHERVLEREFGWPSKFGCTSWDPSRAMILG